MNQKVKKRRGGGGAWRIFMQQQSGGTTGRPNIRDLAVQYRGLALHQRKSLKVAGRASTLVAHNRKQDAQLKRRQVQKLSVHTARNRFAQSTKGQSHIQRCIRAHAEGHQSGKGVAYSVALAQHVDRQDAIDKKHELEKARDIVESFKAKFKQAHLQHISHIPLPEDMFEPVPLGFGVAGLKVRSTFPEGQALQSCHFACTTRASNLGTSLEKYWQELHETISACTETFPTKDVAKPTPCQLTGVCHCCQDGKMLVRFRNLIHQQMKNEFGDPASKTLVNEGHVVICLQSFDINAEPGNQAVVAEHWFHWGLQYWSPYRGTYMRMHRPSDMQSPKDPVGEGRVYLEVTGAQQEHNTPTYPAHLRKHLG